MNAELKLYEVRRAAREFVQPEDLCRLARAGVRLLPSSRLLLVQVPAGLVAASDWTEMDGLLARHARSLQLMADQVASTLSQADVEEVVRHRIPRLHAVALPVVQATVGGELAELLAHPPGDSALGDLLCAAYILGLTEQVNRNAEPRRGERLGDRLRATLEVGG